MKNIPNSIYLQTGDGGLGSCEDFKDLTDVTWSVDKIQSGDTQFINASLIRKHLLHIHTSVDDCKGFGFNEAFESAWSLLDNQEAKASQ